MSYAVTSLGTSRGQVSKKPCKRVFRGVCPQNLQYNGENRPVRWPHGNAVITMSFDRMGRRVTKNTQRFVYNGYLQIVDFEHTTSNFEFQAFVWDPTENVATRPLVWFSGTATAYYTHDGNKNVSEVLSANSETIARYDYAPFGAVTARHGTSTIDNPWRFSSEYADDDTAMIYYNYRHYDAVMGRWMSRDKVEDNNDLIFVRNNPILHNDILGLKFDVQYHKPGEVPDGGWHDAGGMENGALTKVTKQQRLRVYLTDCPYGKVKLNSSFGDMQIDVYFRTEYDVAPMRPFEDEHVECYRKYYNKVQIMRGVLSLFPCLCPQDANRIMGDSISRYENLVDECDKCNEAYDRKGGPHGH